MWIQILLEMPHLTLGVRIMLEEKLLMQTSRRACVYEAAMVYNNHFCYGNQEIDGMPPWQKRTQTLRLQYHGTGGKGVRVGISRGKTNITIKGALDQFM